MTDFLVFTMKNDEIGKKNIFKGFPQRIIVAFLATHVERGEEGRGKGIGCAYAPT